MKSEWTKTKLIGVLTLLSLPLTAVAGGNQAWTKQQGEVANLASDQHVRDWAAIDSNKDNVISAQEMSAFLEAWRAGVHKAGGASALTTEDSNSRTFDSLSSTELGMYFSHGAGKQSQSSKVYIPEATYTVTLPEKLSDAPAQPTGKM